MSTPARPYLSNGQVLETPRLGARVRNLADHTYNALGLYVASLFSLDSYAAAEASSYNVNNQSAGSRSTSSRGYGGSGGGGGGGSGPGSGGSGGKKVGRVDDIRGPECKSCQ